MDNPKPAPRNTNRNNRNRKNRDRAHHTKNQGQRDDDDSQQSLPSVSSPSPDIEEIKTVQEASPPTNKRLDSGGKRSKPFAEAGTRLPSSSSPQPPIPSTSGSNITQHQKNRETTTHATFFDQKNTQQNPSTAASSRRGERNLRPRQHRDLPPISVEDDNDLDTLELQRQIDKLERDLQRRDRELEEERMENEKCLESIKRLERDKVDLKRDVEGFRDEAEDYRRTLEEYKERSSRDRSKSRRPVGMMEGGGGGKNRMPSSTVPMMTTTDDIDDSEDADGDFTDTRQHQQTGFDIAVQQKNREIEQLIEDTERLEEEKETLQDKLNTLKDSLSEATRQIESMTNDHFDIKSRLQKADERIKQVEEEKAILSIRERELLGYKDRHDQYLENLCTAVDIRVDVWKKIMFDKDEEIDRLNSKISSLMSQIPNTQLDSERSTMQLMNQKLVEREHQIALLNEQLAQATEEIESSSQLIESLQSKLSLTEDSKKTEKLVKSLQTTVRKLEEKLERRTKQLSHVEKEAEEKSRTLTSIMGRMAAYESGQYGLSEAVSEIKEHKTQIRIRDKQVEGVTQEINVIQMQISDLQEENEMLRDKLGLENDADLKRETRRYTRTMKNELSALRSKVGHLEEEVVTLKTRNYSLKKQLNQYDLSQQNVVMNGGHLRGPPHPSSSLAGGGSLFAPPPYERDRDGPDGGSVASASTVDAVQTQGDMFIRNLTGFGVKGEEWKEKYEIILEENSALRRGLHEILDCMHKMTDEGNTEVMIQAPVLEELLREMSARGIINYPYPISSFHMKVCNLEGKCSQLREDLHRLRHDERDCRQELFQAQGVIQTLTEQLKMQQQAGKNVTYQRGKSVDIYGKGIVDPDGGDEPETTTDVVFSKYAQEEHRDGSTVMPTRRDFVSECLQEEIELLRNQNESLKEKIHQEKNTTLENFQQVLNKANELLKEKTSNNNGNADELKIEYLQAIRENQTNEINSLIKRIAEIENDNTARLGYLQRFKLKAIHQISAFQQIVETSVPIHLFHVVKKENRLLFDKLVQLQEKDETLVVKTIAFHKNAEQVTELRRERDKLEEELSKCQARLLETAAELAESQNNESKVTKPSSKESSSQNFESISHKLNHALRMNDSLKEQVEELNATRKGQEAQIQALGEKYSNSLKMEKEAREKYIDTVAREEYDLLVNKLVTTEEGLVIARDDALKWKEFAEMTQNQIKAIENIKYFEKLELDYMAKEVLDLQSQSDEKALLAKAHHHMLIADKDKHLAIQQVEKLLSKLTQLEAHDLQQSKIHQEREMSLISMHTHAIMRYRNLFAALHDTHATHQWGGRGSGVVTSLQSSDVKEAFEMFEQTRKKCSELEDQILEERLKAEEYEQKCKLLESAVNSLKDGSGQEVVYESLQKVQEARVEVARWKRKAEQKDRDCVTLQESVTRLESKTCELEEDRIKLEHNLEVKDSLTSALMAKSMEDLQNQLMPSNIMQSTTAPQQTLSSTSMPLMISSSTNFETLLLPKPPTMDKECQSEGGFMPATFVSATSTTNLEGGLMLQSDWNLEKEKMIQALENLKTKVAELKGNIRAKEDALNEIRLIRSKQERDATSGLSTTTTPTGDCKDLQDALVVARETITSLQDRLKSKDDNVNQYRRLLAEVRTEMTTSTERHVQEMRALQMTIHQQQQAFTRMKSTLSQPVRDSTNVEGTIKDQLTRIHELEDEVSQLQHAMSNTAAQLTAARSEAHRWRCHAESKIKEADSVRDQQHSNFESLEELGSLRRELHETQRKLEDAQQQLSAMRMGSARESMTDLVNVLRSEMEEKDKQIEAYSKSLHNLKTSGTYSDKSSLEERLHIRETELNLLKDEIKELHRTVAAQQLRISKSKALNQKSGVSHELEELRGKHKDLLEAKAKIDKDFADLNRKRDEDELKKIKSAESIARWEESKKWKKIIEKHEARVGELESENDRFKRTSQNLRLTISRLEKEKLVFETRLNSKQNSSRASSASASGTNTTDRFIIPSSEQSNILAQGEIARLKIQLQDLQELNEKIEFEGREEAERLKMEVKLLKERIVSQERQLTAYQIAQKGDTKVIAEIEGMAQREAQLQKEIRRLEEDNLNSNLQIEQLRLESPRLRDRVQYLQKMVEALKAEKPMSMQGETDAAADKRNQKTKSRLAELEKTIQALRQVIDKLQSENKKLKHTRPPPSTTSSAAGASSEKLKTSVDGIMEENKSLLDKVQYLEHENEKLTRKFLESSSRVESSEFKLSDAEKRAISAEMKLRTFLNVANNDPSVPDSGELSSSGGNIPPTSSTTIPGYETLVQKMKTMQEELDAKSRLLSAAKQSLRAAEKATAPKPTTSPRLSTHKDDSKNNNKLPVPAATSAYLALV